MTQERALIFPFLNKSDSGTYGCTATSNMGSYTAYFTLNVNGESLWLLSSNISLRWPSLALRVATTSPRVEVGWMENACYQKALPLGTRDV